MAEQIIAYKAFDVQHVRTPQDLLGIPYIVADRDVLELTDEYRQVIPYISVHRDGLWLLYKRCKSTFKDLHARYSIGFGGHVNACDMQDDILESIYACAVRELKEEIDIGIDTFIMSNIILLNNSTADKRHIGIHCKVSSRNTPISKEPDIQLEGFLSYHDCKKHTLESWSQYILCVEL